jgi:hypothetical protein
MKPTTITTTTHQTIAMSINSAVGNCSLAKYNAWTQVLSFSTNKQTNKQTNNNKSTQTNTVFIV